MILITGATGNVGKELVKQLLEAGEKVRVFVRSPEKVAHWKGQVEIVTGEFGDQESFARAAQGADSAFLMNGPDGEAFSRMLQTLQLAGCRKIVFLSTILASDPESIVGQMHKAKEDAIRASGIQGFFLRPTGFMSNVFQWLESANDESVLYNGMGSGRFAPIAPDDIASVACQVLTDSGLNADVFEMTGGELVTVADEAKVLTEVTAKTVRLVDVPVEKALEKLVGRGVPPFVAASVGRSLTAVREGRGERMTGTVKRLLARDPMSFAEWAQLHIAKPA
jgi:uncharacterized protein YbjT (DUF2867 family)